MRSMVALDHATGAAAHVLASSVWVPECACASGDGGGLAGGVGGGEGGRAQVALETPLVLRL